MGPVFANMHKRSVFTKPTLTLHILPRTWPWNTVSHTFRHISDRVGVGYNLQLKDVISFLRVREIHSTVFFLKAVSILRTLFRLIETVYKA